MLGAVGDIYVERQVTQRYGVDMTELLRSCRAKRRQGALVMATVPSLLRELLSYRRRVPFRKWIPHVQNRQLGYGACKDFAGEQTANHHRRLARYRELGPSLHPCWSLPFTVYLDLLGPTGPPW